MGFDVERLSKFPEKPGVYIMKNRNSKILYVGKAKHLRRRVKQYFALGGDGRYMIPYLVAKVFYIETIVVSSEKEALLLENNLIKKHKPKYNALLKDDKSYIALKVTNKSKWPKVVLVRYRGQPKPDGLYFGPYTSATAARKTLDLLNKLFPLRQCSDDAFSKRTRPCILYDMKRCIGPCVNRCTKDEYDVYVDKTIKFLRGKTKDVIDDLYEQIKKYSDTLKFEKAAKILKTIRYIEQTLESQKVDDPLGGDRDVLALFRQGEDVVLTLLLFRQGKLVGSKNFNFSNSAQDDGSLLESFLLQHYPKQKDLPGEILVPTLASNALVISDLLSKDQLKKVKVIVPKKGGKLALIKMAISNAEAYFKRERDAKAINEKILSEMHTKFRLTQYPGLIECFDNSNLSGSQAVSCLVSFTDGEKDTSGYRKYLLKSAKAFDDYGAMYEVLTRRYKKAKVENNFPNLVIIDGGKGHLNVAIKVFKELNIINVDVIGVAKESGRHDRGMTKEKVYLPNVKDPIILKNTSGMLFFLQKIRDEAHRFAITFQRKRRSKTSLKSQLDDILGVGPVKKRALLKFFGSVKKIKEASYEDLKKLSQLTDANIKAIISHFQD